VIPSTGSGHLIVVGWQAGAGANASTTIGVTDSGGNSYVEAARAIDTGASSVVDLWYAQNCVAGVTSVAITPSATVTNAAVVVWEFSGVSSTGLLDQTTVLNSQAAKATPIGGDVRASTANDVIVALAAVAGSIRGSVSGNAFSSDSTLKGGGWAHLIAPAAGSYSAQWHPNPTGTFAAVTASLQVASGSGTFSPCDLNNDGVIDSQDVSIAINLILSPPAVCPVTISGAGSCNAAVVQRVIAASLPGGTCHPVVLNWTASTTSGVAGYNVYRSATSGSGYAKLNSSLIAATTYVDGTSQPGQTYYYVATAVDSSGNESAYSSPPAAATIPVP
jgi:hypothetical protein